jgi:uracil-DNA glycosylase
LGDGVAGHRVRGFLAKLGIDRSYVIINAQLYSLYGSATPTHSQARLADRYDWIDAILASSPVEVVVTFGTVATKVWAGCLADRAPAAPPPQVAALHPTAHPPEPPGTLPIPRCYATKAPGVMSSSSSAVPPRLQVLYPLLPPLESHRCRRSSLSR